jgi:hypothetical protein
MTPQEMARRAEEARARFDEWVSAQLKTDPTVDPFTLVARCVQHFRTDGEFMGGWFAATLQEGISRHLARVGGAYDAPSPAAPTITTAVPSPARAAAHGNVGPRPPRPGDAHARKGRAPATWRSWLATEKVPVRTKLLRRDDLVAIVASERQEAAAHAVNARLAETLLARMPADNPGLQVGDVWTDDELREAVREAVQPAEIVAIPESTDARKANA